MICTLIYHCSWLYSYAVYESVCELDKLSCLNCGYHMDLYGGNWWNYVSDLLPEKQI